MTDKKIWRNAVTCHNCGKTIESIHRHDFVRCACPDDDSAIWVDGGHDYKRRMFGKDCNYTEIEEEFVVVGPVTLEHSDVLLRVHHPSKCLGETCPVHNRSNHSKRSWVQDWNVKRRRMERISPTSGRRYKDPDSP